jgi:hypothetical protein
MAQRANYYAHEEYEEDLGDVNIEAVVGNYGQGGHGMYEDGKCIPLICVFWCDNSYYRPGEDR